MDQIIDPNEKEKAWEDLGRPEDRRKPIQYAYTVIVDNDGSIQTQIFQPSDSIERLANTFDVYSTCKDLVNDIESQLLAERVAKSVVESLKPADTSKELREKLISALSNRGIETPNA
jgi:hypothetical protein